MTATINTYPQPRLDDLLRDFTYQPETGYLLWNVRRQGVPFGQLAGTARRPTDRLRVHLGRVGYPVELLVWYMHAGEWPTMLPRHHSGQRSDNRMENLYLPEPDSRALVAIAALHGRTQPQAPAQPVSILQARAAKRIPKVAEPTPTTEPT